jgi:hypothetical protein
MRNADFYRVPERSALFASSPEAGTALSSSHPFPRPQTRVSGYPRDLLPTRELTFNASTRAEQVRKPVITARKMSIKYKKLEKKSLNMQEHHENVRLTKKPLWALIIAAFAKI